MIDVMQAVSQLAIMPPPPELLPPGLLPPEPLPPEVLPPLEVPATPEGAGYWSACSKSAASGQPSANSERPTAPRIANISAVRACGWRRGGVLMVCGPDV